MEDQMKSRLHIATSNSVRTIRIATAVLGCIATGILLAGFQAADAKKLPGATAVLCAEIKHGVPQGPLQFREACKQTELQVGNFDDQMLTFDVPLGAFNVLADPGVPGIVQRSGQTTYQTPIFEATTAPNGTADIIDGIIEEGSVYHHDVTLIARTADGRAWGGGAGYLVARRIGSQTIEIFSKLNDSVGSINPPPTIDVLAVGTRRILRVHGNGQDSLQWSAVVQRVKILPP
jgi:hypothetical protein